MDEITTAVRAGIDNDPGHRAVVAPIYLSTTYRFEQLGKPGQYDYSRSGNPTRDVLAETITKLEGGATATVTASGIGAISTVLHAFLSPGDVLVVPHDCYGGSWRLFDALANKGMYELVVINLSNDDAPDVIKELQPKLLWIETPSNPLLRISDIARLAATVQEYGGLVAADNTFCSPVIQRPLDLGADLVVHSSTKFINGHSDVVSGVVVSAEPDIGAQVSWWANALGVTGGAFDSYQVLRGLKTLHIRMAQHQRNAQALAKLLDEHPSVARVHYPGLAAHPQHELVLAQQQGPGAILSFELAGGLPAVEKLLDKLQFFSLAESLGGVESLICHPASMTHAAMPKEVQLAAGISEGLVRISVGIESVAALAADLLTGLDNTLAIN